jgi:hypothetical protein
MTNLFIALGVIAIFAVGLLCALGVIACGESRTYPNKEPK